MNLKNLSNEALLAETKLYVQKEREMTLLVLHHLKEVERRRLFASLGYSSLFDYVTRELGYCAASACRRIDAMRLLKELPALEGKIQNGALTLSAVARAQSFFKKESTTLCASLNVEQKLELMKQLENKSTRQVERELLAIASSPETHLHERVRAVTPTLSEVKFYANDELLEDLERLKGLLAHSHPKMTTAELIAYLAQLGLKKLDPAQYESKRASIKAVMIHAEAVEAKATPEDTNKRRPVLTATPAPNESMRQNMITDPIHTDHVYTNRPPSRYVPRPIVRAVWKRDQSRCTWVDPQTGRQCGSAYQLQLDHRHPFALGGKSDLKNLRLLCAQHNRFEAERIFGLHSQAHLQSIPSTVNKTVL